MDNSVLVALIVTAGSIFTAAATFYLTKTHQLKVEFRKEKLNHYRVLLSSLSDLAVDGTDKDDANRKLALAANTIALVASQRVISALMRFHDEVKFSNPDRSPDRHDQLLKELMLEIRKDIGLTSRDSRSTFAFHLIGSSPKRGRIN